MEWLCLLPAPQVVLLRGQLAGLLDRFGKPDPKDLMGLMEILGDILHRLGTQGVGAASLKMAQHLLPLFEDVRAGQRRSQSEQPKPLPPPTPGACGWSLPEPCGNRPQCASFWEASGLPGL